MNPGIDKEHDKTEDLRGRAYFLVTLGCFRNEVESDMLRSALAGLGMVERRKVEDAQVVLVMTCGFIREACDEGIDTILELDGIVSGEGGAAPLVVLGCMGQRYSGSLLDEMPELSAVLGCSWRSCVRDALLAVLDGGSYCGGIAEGGHIDASRSIDSSENSTLLVKVADGCDRACGFCTIPQIKGPYVSRRPADILAEVAGLSEGREREVILLAQDLTSYGVDLAGGMSGITGLLDGLSELEWVRWIRMLYLQPEGLTAELIEAVAAGEKVCSYFDVPFQHASERVLRSMGRPGSSEEHLGLVERIRSSVVGAAVRSTVMVGYPGETDADFAELMAFIETARFDWLGAFIFSPEEGTAAAQLGGTVPSEVALSRYNMVVEAQDKVEAGGLDRLLGRELEVVIDDVCELEPYDLIGRSYREAPVVDGSIYLVRKEHRGGSTPSGFTRARITGHEGLDLVGEI
jgi:ribosomal protein S12 methylthiotransferase